MRNVYHCAMSPVHGFELIRVLMACAVALAWWRAAMPPPPSVRLQPVARRRSGFMPMRRHTPAW